MCTEGLLNLARPTTRPSPRLSSATGCFSWPAGSYWLVLFVSFHLLPPCNTKGLIICYIYTRLRTLLVVPKVSLVSYLTCSRILPILSSSLITLILHCNSFKFCIFFFKHININPRLDGGCSPWLVNHLKSLSWLFTYYFHSVHYIAYLFPKHWHNTNLHLNLI